MATTDVGIHLTDEDVTAEITDFKTFYTLRLKTSAGDVSIFVDTLDQVRRLAAQIAAGIVSPKVAFPYDDKANDDA